MHFPAEVPFGDNLSIGSRRCSFRKINSLAALGQPTCVDHARKTISCEMYGQSKRLKGVIKSYLGGIFHAGARRKNIMKIAARIFGFLAFVLLALAGCHELGHVDGLGDYGTIGGSDIVGEVRYVDARAREIEVRTEAGRTVNVRYDNRTRVTFRQKDYSVSNLEPGDYVAMRAQQDRDGRLFTDLVTVRESAQDRGGSGGRIGRPDRLERFEGTVERVDARRGTFEVRDRGRLVVVSVAFNAPRSVMERFNRLRQGDVVRIEGRFSNQDRFDLENFL